MALHSKASVRGSSLDDIYAAPEMEENAAGNRTTIPRPANLQYGYTGKYDAWNRLVSLYDGNAYVQVNQYDGLHRRIVRDETGGNGDSATSTTMRIGSAWPKRLKVAAVRPPMRCTPTIRTTSTR